MREIEVSAGLIWRGERFLASRRPEGTPFAGHWELPGGKWQAGETGSEALARELREELGIYIEGCRFLKELTHCYREENLRVKLHFYEVSAYGGEPIAREGQSLAWLTPEEVESYAFLAADAEVLGALGQKKALCGVSQRDPHNSARGQDHPRR